MPLQPSRRDILGPPPQDVTDLANVVRHQSSYLRSLDPGILDGRWRTPRPTGNGTSQIVGSDGAGGEAESVIGEDGDRLVLADLDTQVWTLSYTPIAETLHVHWHPDAGAGVEWKRGEHYDLAEDDQIVTIYASALASGRARVGDVFSAQYLRLDGEDPEEEEPAVPPGPASVIFRDSHVAHYGTGGVPTTFALPTLTEVGDLLAIATNGVVTDGRMSLVGSSGDEILYLGFASSLGALTVDMSGAPGGTGPQWAISCIALDTDAVGWTAASTTTDSSMHAGDTLNIPQIVGVSASLCAAYSTHSVVDGATSGAIGYTDGYSSGSAKKSIRVDYWTDGALGASPAGPIGWSGGPGACDVIVVGLIGP